MKSDDEPLAKWALDNGNDVIQAVMLARSEAEFFDSKPAFYCWASELRPDDIKYGFTLTHVALVLSEELQIPIIGFVLQPTVIPSQQYDALMPIPVGSDAGEESKCRLQKMTAMLSDTSNTLGSHS